MPSKIKDEILDVAILAAKVGGSICRSYFDQELAIESKDVSNLVTRADIESENAIVKTIQEHFPNHSILAEEQQKAELSSEELWIVDPLDGTNNFAHQIPHFAVSIAFWRQGIPYCGVIYNPVRDELYYTTKGFGAFCDEKQLSVCDSERLSECLIGCGFYYDRGTMMRATLRAVESCFEKNIHGIRRFGTASLDLIQVATGRYGGFFEYRLAPWDFAAGMLFVTEAGGQVTTCKGQPLTLEQSTILATNGRIHDKLGKIVEEHHPPESG